MACMACLYPTGPTGPLWCGPEGPFRANCLGCSYCILAALFVFPLPYTIGDVFPCALTLSKVLFSRHSLPGCSPCGAGASTLSALLTPVGPLFLPMSYAYFPPLFRVFSAFAFSISSSLYLSTSLPLLPPCPCALRLSAVLFFVGT